MIPEERERARVPLYQTPVRDLYGLQLADGGRVEVRRQASVLAALVHTPAGGGEPVEFDLRRWHYRQWATQIEDREYSEALRCLIATRGLFEHPEWVTDDPPPELEPESMTVVDDLRATWRGRYGADQVPPGGGAQLCSACIAAEPQRSPVTVWSPAPAQHPCAHRDAAARALAALVGRHEELVFELLDLLVVAQAPGPAGSPNLRRFVLPSDWMRALLGHWLLGRRYVHGDHPWRSRGAPRHRRFSHRALRAEGHGELTAEERYAALAWCINPDDLSLMPEEPESVASPDASWWTETAAPTLAGLRIYPEGGTPKARSATRTGVERAKSPGRAAPASGVRPSVPVPAPEPAPRVVVRRTPAAKPRRVVAAAPASPSAREKSEGLEETLSSLTAGLAALSQIMGGPKNGRR